MVVDRDPKNSEEKTLGSWLSLNQIIIKIKTTL